MGIRTSSILTDATTAFTGGTAAAASVLRGYADKVKLFFGSNSSFLSRVEAVFSTQEARVNSGAPNGYTQQRANVSLRVPKTLANGNLTFSTLTIGLSCDIEITDAEKETILVYGAQLLQDSDFQNFWKALSLD